jgi:hypothetical protein
MRPTTLASLAALAGLGLGGCFTAEFDPTLTGVFACDSDDDCDADQTCAIDELCRDRASLPFVDVAFPVTLANRTLELSTDAAIVPQISLKLDGTLELAEPGGDNVFGEGHIAVLVDDLEPLLFDSISLSSFSQDIPIPNEAGAHRLAVELRQNDSTPYGGGARQTLIVWVDETDSVVPRVVIVRPWPGTPFQPDVDGNAEVEVETFEFTANAIVDEGSGDGHVHVYTTGIVPDCAAEEPATAAACNIGVPNYTALVDDDDPTTPLEGALGVPDTGSQTVEFGAILMNRNHCPFIPGSDNPDACVATSSPVFDVVSALRPPPDDGDDGDDGPPPA